MRSKLSVMTALTPSRLVPLAAQSREDPEPYSLPPKTVKVTAAPSEFSAPGKETITFDAKVRIDTPGEADYYRNGGILQYVLRSLV
jgi:aconitase A